MKKGGLRSLHILIDDSDYYALKRVFPMWGEITFVFRTLVKWIIKNPEEARQFIRERSENDEV